LDLQKIEKIGVTSRAVKARIICRSIKQSSCKSAEHVMKEADCLLSINQVAMALTVHSAAYHVKLWRVRRTVRKRNGQQ